MYSIYERKTAEAHRFAGDLVKTLASQNSPQVVLYDKDEIPVAGLTQYTITSRTSIDDPFPEELAAVEVREDEDGVTAFVRSSHPTTNYSLGYLLQEQLYAFDAIETAGQLGNQIFTQNGGSISLN